MLREKIYGRILTELRKAALKVYGRRLVSLVVFGSVGRGTPRFDSDIDLLLVVEGLPRGRLARVEEFSEVEKLLEPVLYEAQREGIVTELSPVFKTPEELKQGSLLFLDLVEDSLILYDRHAFFADFLKDFRDRLRAMGAERIPYRGAWYWRLKKDYKPGEIFEI